MYTDELVLSMKGISKSFPGVKALENVDLEVHRGEVLALLGENGAGKSTLIKILSGDYTADEGTIEIEGNPVLHNDPFKAINLGVSVIYQELNNSDPLTVAENIYMGNLPMKGGLIDYKKLYMDTDAMLSRVGLTHVNAKQNLGDLSIAEKQMVEIAKALTHNVKILVMDEPTASLNDEEIGILFSLVRKLSNDGTSIIYISHRLDEVFEISDNIQVMRDGHKVSVLKTRETNKEELIRHMVGRDISNMYPDRSDIRQGDVMLQVENLTSDFIKGVSFDVRKGEILGLFGLMGAGRTEVVEMIIGDRKKTGGRILVEGEEAIINSPSDAKKYGIGYLPSDRKKDGLFLVHSIGKNISINVLDQIVGKLNLISDKKAKILDRKWIKALKIKTPSDETPAMSLSGGNQQKLIVARWMAANPKLLILNDPTRGIDVSAKAEIYNLLNELTRQGIAVIIVSSELPEVMSMSDRIVVLHEGRYKGTIKKEDFSQERLLTIAIGGENINAGE